MTKYVTADERSWFSASIRGQEMKGSTLWNEGHDVATRIFRMPKGMQIPLHKHEVWVQVVVLSGKMHVSIGDRTVGPGGFYFVEPGDSHIETAVEDSEILVIKKLPDPADANQRLM